MKGVARVGTLLHVLRHVTARLTDGAGMVAYNLAVSVRGFLDAHEVLGGRGTESYFTIHDQEHHHPTLGVGDAVEKANAVASSAELRLARDGSEADGHASPLSK